MLAIVIPLATLIGFAEECTFRGYLPLVLAAKTGLPSAAVIGISGVIFGVSSFVHPIYQVLRIIFALFIKKYADAPQL